MKKRRLLGITILFLCAICIISCSSDDEENCLNFTTASLKQTQWTGTLDESYISYGEEVSYTYDIGIIFYTESEGKSGLDKDESKFKYSIDDKILVISDGDPWLNGYWLLVQFDKDKITLENSTGGQYSYKATLTLIRKY